MFSFGDAEEKRTRRDFRFAPAIAAAALEAVADQVVPEEELLMNARGTRHWHKAIQRAETRSKLLAIAAELRGDTATQEDWEDIQTAIERKDSVPIPTTLEELAQEMRPEVVDLPQANSDVCGEEGMERARRRMFEENDELMRKLADS